MAITFNTNIASLSAQRNLNKNTASLNQSLARLASGYKINSSKDNAAGLQISNKLTAQIRGNGQAIQNAQDGISMLSVAEGAYTQMQDNLQRMRELTVQFANGTLGDDQKNAIKTEVYGLIDEIEKIQESTQYNGNKFFSGSRAQYVGTVNSAANAEGFTIIYGLSFYDSGASYKIQVGANSSLTNDAVNIGEAFKSIDNIAGYLKILFPTIPSAQSSQLSRAYLTTLDSFMYYTSQQISTVGTLQNRLQGAVDNLMVTNENYSSARSRILDVDVAQESANLSRNQVLQQASVSILSQANQQGSLILQLLGR